MTLIRLILTLVTLQLVGYDVITHGVTHSEHHATIPIRSRNGV